MASSVFSWLIAHIPVAPLGWSAHRAPVPVPGRNLAEHEVQTVEDKQTAEELPMRGGRGGWSEEKKSR